MKLIEKTSFYYIAFSIIGFIIGGFIFYHIIFSILNSRTNDDLKTEKQLIEGQIIQSDSIPDYTPLFGHQIEVTSYDKRVIPIYALKDTTIIDTISNTQIPYRYLISSNNKNNKFYTIEIFKPLIDSNQLLKDIFYVMLIMFLFLLMSLILTNYLISKRAWSTFYNTLEKINNYDINSGNGLVLSQSKYTEFKKLNEVLVTMSNRIAHNYLNLKEFTENASHEIQTPLAIIKSKLELLIQSQPISDEQLNIVQSMYNAVTRLSKLNTNLVLLSKIENSQFKDVSTINISQVIESVLVNLEDIIAQKELIINKIIDVPELEIVINQTLIEVLMINLISNAVKHNIKNGTVDINLDSKSFIISNTGLCLEMDPKHLFNRFKKGNISSESLGLGLSIVEKIANIYNMSISYTHESGYHTLTLLFNR